MRKSKKFGKEGRFRGMAREILNVSAMCRLAALYQARLRKVNFSGDCLEDFEFLRCACSLGIAVRTLEIQLNHRFLQMPLVNLLVFTMPLA